MKPDVQISQHPEDPKQQVVTFDPPVASWVFGEGHTLEELWAELIQASAALMQDHLEEPFDEEMQKKTKGRILTVLLYWKSKGWVAFDAQPELSPTSSVSLAPSTG